MALAGFPDDISFGDVQFAFFSPRGYATTITSVFSLSELVTVLLTSVFSLVQNNLLNMVRSHQSLITSGLMPTFILLSLALKALLDLSPIHLCTFITYQPWTQG